MSAYAAGAVRAGWCCATNDCHRTFRHGGHPCRGFARFVLHRALRHGKFTPPQAIGTSSTWTLTAQATWRAS